MMTLFMSFAYVSGGWTPSGLAIAALNDRHFYIALSMTVSALLAVAQWDSLVVDVRDAAILEPLPVRPTVIRRAKLAAVAILGLAAALLVNVMPTLDLSVAPRLHDAAVRPGDADAHRHPRAWSRSRPRPGRI